MLLGEYNQNIDVKGRVNIPSKFREDLGQSFVISKGLNNCISIYPKAEWEKFMEKILPTCTSVEVFLENDHEGNMVTMTTSANDSGKPMFKWDNSS
ncbi:MAG: MraZ N-terminal domain-containing protein, partial [Oscillospiraceae bacterium]